MKKFNFIGIVAGILSIIFAIIIFGMEVGNSERDIQYGGDAYTGIQNAAAQTARNVVHTNELIRFGFGAVLLVTGLALISLNGVALVNNKEETNTSSLPQTTEIKPVESETFVTVSDEKEEDQPVEKSDKQEKEKSAKPKRTVFILLIVFLVIALVGVATVVIINSMNNAALIEYAEYNNGYKVVKISAEATGEVVIPETYKGMPVTYIDSFVFFNNTNITKIQIPKSISYFGYHSFAECKNLKNITFTGTKAQWESIIKSSGWDYGIPNYTVHCTDGDIEK